MRPVATPALTVDAALTLAAAPSATRDTAVGAGHRRRRARGRIHRGLRAEQQRVGGVDLRQVAARVVHTTIGAVNEEGQHDVLAVIERDVECEGLWPEAREVAAPLHLDLARLLEVPELERRTADTDLIDEGCNRDRQV